MTLKSVLFNMFCSFVCLTWYTVMKYEIQLLWNMKFNFLVLFPKINNTRSISESEYHAQTIILKRESTKKSRHTQINDGNTNVHSIHVIIWLDRNTCNAKNHVHILSAYHRLNKTQRSFSQNGPRIWNTIPLEIRSTNLVEKFKIKLHEHISDTTNWDLYNTITYRTTERITIIQCISRNVKIS